MYTPVVIYVLINDISFILVAQKMFTGLDSFLLTAIPLFILAGNLMNAANLTEELVEFCKMIVSRIQGGLAHANVQISIIFAGMTGAGVSNTPAVGSILIPGMIKDGYEKVFIQSAITMGGVMCFSGHCVLVFIHLDNRDVS